MMNRAILLAPMIVVVLLVGHSNAFDFLLPSDPIIAIDTDPPGSNSNYPAAESPAKAIDGTLTKYLNFGEEGSGFIVTPGGSTIVQSFRMTTANDANERDPASFQLWGTNDAIISPDNSTGLLENWNLIDGFALTGPLALPLTRNALGPVVPITNATAYASYKMLYPTVRNAAAANSMQIAEVSFFQSNDGTGTDILDPTDPIRAVHIAFDSRSPAAEGPGNAIDQSVNTKYLNFGRENSGFIVTPSFGSSVVNRFQISTANDSPSRDPASWELYGTNDPVTSGNNSQGNAENWTLIDSGTLDLPMARLTAGAEVTVNNSAGAFTSYRMVFPTIRDAAAGDADSMQFGEIVLRAPDDAVLRINRQTGAAVFNASANTTFKSYQVSSPNNGGLDDTNWTSIASTNADPDDTWNETSTPGAHDVLSEEDLPGGANNGFTIAAGNSYSLGNIWRILPTTFEDVVVNATRVNGQPAAVGVEFVGTDIPLGDYSGNGTVGPEDWPTFRAGYGGDYTGASRVDAYLGGDLDGDFDSDLEDFNLFVAAAGGLGALFGDQQVPEPSSLALAVGIIIGGLSILRFRKPTLFAAVAVGTVTLLAVPAANAQSFTNVGGAPVGITIPVDQMNETATSGPEHLFDDDFLDDTPTTINDEMFILDYNDPNLNCANCLQYQGLGPDPKTVFFDYGSPITANWFAYAQRSGGDPTADRVGMFELWFSNTDFGGVVPATTPDAVVKLQPTDTRLRDSVLRPYTLSGDHTGRYVAMRLTVSALSANQPTNNIGGHEFRLLDGPGDVILQVDRSNGAMTLKNNLSDAQAIEMKSYKIESPAGGLDPLGFNGLHGDSVDFPAGNGSGNGWEVGGGSNAKRLVEAYFSGVSTLPTGTSGLSLGNAYNEFSLAEDLEFTWTNAAGELYNARVEYVGQAANLPGDYNTDGKVDAGDYVLWRKNPGAFGGPAGYNTWRSNFGNPPGSGSGLGDASAVPEPSTCASIALATIIGFVTRRRKT